MNTKERQSPEAIQEVPQPIGETSAMALIITLPGKLPIILLITLQIIVNVMHPISISAINHEQKLADS